MDIEKDLNTATWLKFFKEAGIPTKTGASYALIFVENRINKDMLSELTVDYLRLMGITLMGDIIAILRHCKTVHQDSLRKVVILQSKETPRRYSSSDTSSSSSSESSSSSDDDVEMVEVTKSSSKKVPHSSRKNDKLAKMTNIHVKTEPSEKKVVKQISSSVKSKVIGKIDSSSTENGSKIPAKAVKRKYSNSESESEKISVIEPQKKVITTSSGKSILRTAISSSKKFKAVEENEVMGPKLPPPKKTVFERLGAENDPPLVSSTTETPKPEVVETKFTRTITSVNLPPKSVRLIEDEDITSTPTKGASVFDRLGGLNKAPSALPAKSPALQYAGIFKSAPAIKKPIRPLDILNKVGTMRADQPEVPVKLRAATGIVQATSVRSRLGNSPVTNTYRPPIKLNRSMLTSAKPKVESEGIFANTAKPKNLSVRDRLGHTPEGERGPATSYKRTRSLSSPFSTPIRDNRVCVPLSRTELLKSKKVSFGRVEHKVITPLRTSATTGLQRNNIRPKTGVHSRLGVVKH